MPDNQQELIGVINAYTEFSQKFILMIYGAIIYINLKVMANT